MKYYMFAILALSCLTIQGCDKTKKVFGLKRESPDEFTVLDRAPLSVPPGIGLKPPVAGAARPGEKSPHSKAKEIVLEESSHTAEGQKSPSEEFLLESANSIEKDPEIRTKLEKEAAAQKPKETMIQKVLGQKNKRKEDVIDPQEEYKRLEGKTHPSAEKAKEMAG